MTGQAWDRLAEFLHEVGHLERTPRSGYALLRQEGQSVAAHSYRVAVVAMALADLTPGADGGQVIQMSLIHDLAESRTSDLHHLSQRYTEVDEDRVVRDQTEGLSFGEPLREIHRQYREGVSVEARLVKDADQIELLLSLRERMTSQASEESEHWIDRLLDRLQTDAARALGRAILRADPDSWWSRRGADPC